MTEDLHPAAALAACERIRDLARDLFDRFIPRGATIPIEIDSAGELTVLAGRGGPLFATQMEPEGDLPRRWSIARTVHVSNYPHSPDEVDCVEIRECRGEAETASALAVEWFASEIDGYIEAIGLEDQANQEAAWAAEMTASNPED
jgi:hypothetical protein